MSNVGLILSVIGVIFLLVALIGGQSGKIPGDSGAGLFLNVIGGAIASVGAAYDGSWAFVALEGIWALISLVGFAAFVVKCCKRKKMVSRPTNLRNAETTSVEVELADRKPIDITISSV